MQPKITRVTETTVPGERGEVVQVIRVDFTVGTHGPFSMTFPKQNFQTADANAKLQAFAQQISTLQGIS